MDILSSQANLAGYKAVIESFAHFEKAIPMMMTAAGTIPAAKVLVVGAGVAGFKQLQLQNEWVQLYLQQMLEWLQKNKLKVWGKIFNS
jgi:NAD/NADP transhydrogenase alpha subunit